MVETKKDISEVQVCNQCGEINYDNVNFCQDCGGMLKNFKHIYCKICGTKNLAENRVCDECKNLL